MHRDQPGGVWLGGYAWPVDAVHEPGSRIFAQLWHTGALSHPDFFDGALPMSASDVDPVQLSVTPSGRKPTVAPRPMTRDEIRQTVSGYAQAARNAIESSTARTSNRAAMVCSI